MPAPTFVARNSGGHSGTGTGTISTAGVADGDIMLLHVGRQQVTGAYSSGLTGWTALLTAQDTAATVNATRHWVFWKLAASEPGTYTPVFSTSSNGLFHLMILRGQHATPWEDTDHSIPSGTTSLASPTLTVSGNNRLAILLAAMERTGSSPGDFNPLTGYDFRTDIATGGLHMGGWTKTVNTGSVSETIGQAGASADTIIWGGILVPADASDPSSGGLGSIAGSLPVSLTGVMY